MAIRRARHGQQRRASNRLYSTMHAGKYPGGTRPLLPIRVHRLFGVHPGRPETYSPRAFAMERRLMVKGYKHLKMKRYWYRRLFGYR